MGASRKIRGPVAFFGGWVRELGLTGEIARKLPYIEVHTSKNIFSLYTLLN